MDGLSKSVEDIEFPYNKGLILAVSLVFFLKTEKMPAKSWRIGSVRRPGRLQRGRSGVGSGTAIGCSGSLSVPGTVRSEAFE
jgi:hypothetical protein